MVAWAIVVFALTGIDVIWDVATAFLADFTAAIGNILFTWVLPGLFQYFVTYLFGGAVISLQTAFTLVLFLIAMGIYIKYVHGAA